MLSGLGLKDLEIKFVERFNLISADEKMASPKRFCWPARELFSGKTQLESSFDQATYVLLHTGLLPRFMMVFPRVFASNTRCFWQLIHPPCERCPKTCFFALQNSVLLFWWKRLHVACLPCVHRSNPFRATFQRPWNDSISPCLPTNILVSTRVSPRLCETRG